MNSKSISQVILILFAVVTTGLITQAHAGRNYVGHGGGGPSLGTRTVMGVPRPRRHRNHHAQQSIR